MKFKQKFFFLVDCNNFFVSCERVFAPELRKKPVVVLSNNDGCIIARSNEAKALGIRMGEPVHEARDIILANQVRTFSCNFPLYGELSRRVMKILAESAEAIEVYSIDEAFLEFSLEVRSDQSPEEQLDQLASLLKARVERSTGVSISIGVGRTKTLAKVATHHAKKISRNIFVLVERPLINSLLSNLEVAELWGVGRRLSVRLRALNINTALDLAKANDKFIRQKFNVMLLRTKLELNEIACIALDQSASRKKSIASTRSFGKKIYDYKNLSEAVSCYASRVAVKLRKNNLLVNQLIVFIRTNPYAKNYPPELRNLRNSIKITLSTASNLTPDLIKAALSGLKQIYLPNVPYHKAGVIAVDLTYAEEQQINCFDEKEYRLENKQLMQVMDNVNNKYGSEKIVYAASGLERHWKMKSASRSPSYLTSWSELLTVK